MCVRERERERERERDRESERERVREKVIGRGGGESKEAKERFQIDHYQETSSPSGHIEGKQPPHQVDKKAEQLKRKVLLQAHLSRKAAENRKPHLNEDHGEVLVEEVRQKLAHAHVRPTSREPATDAEDT